MFSENNNKITVRVQEAVTKKSVKFTYDREQVDLDDFGYYSKFMIEEDQYARIKKHFKNMNKVEYTFSPGGIGTGIVAKSGRRGIDVNDVDKW
jgi:hypothetical protein